MLIYQCAHQHGLLTGDMKARMASAITDAHVEATGALRVFVHVFHAAMFRLTVSYWVRLP